MLKKFLLTLFLPAAALTTPALAATSNEVLATVLEVQLTSSGSYDDYLATFSRLIRQYDTNGDGLTETELDIVEQIDAARNRSRQIGLYLTADLNGDFRVARSEYQRLVDISGSGFADGTAFNVVDTNADGVISFEEMAAPDPRRNLERSKAQLKSRTIDLDPTPAGPFTLEDAHTLVDELFAAADLDKDKRLSAGERSDFLKANRPGRTSLLDKGPANEAACDLPRPVAGEQLVVLGAYEGKAFSSVSLGGPSNATYVVDVPVDAGDKPLYVIGSSYESVIWRFSGAVQRVHRVALFGYKPQGALGIDKAAVSFDPSGQCFERSYKFDGFDGAVAKRRYELFAPGAEIKFFGSYALDGVAIPSGTTAPKATLSGDKPKFTVAALDAAAVVAATPVAPYAVLPGAAGIDQLLKSGALEEIERGAYRIVKPIPYYPASLTGGNSVRFLLGKGVPEPAGDPGHSCVISEDTAEPIGRRSRCR